MNDPINRHDAIDALDGYKEKPPIIESDYDFGRREMLESCVDVLKDLPSEQPDNQVHLCDSCKHTYPECPSEKEDVIFGNGIWGDNICACAKYVPFAQKDGNEDKYGTWHILDDCANEGVYCSKCHKKVFKYDFSNTMKWKNFKYCPNCGVPMMKGEKDESL